MEIIRSQTNKQKPLKTEEDTLRRGGGPAEVRGTGETTSEGESKRAKGIVYKQENVVMSSLGCLRGGDTHTHCAGVRTRIQVPRTRVKAEWAGQPAVILTGRR